MSQQNMDSNSIELIKLEIRPSDLQKEKICNIKMLNDLIKERDVSVRTDVISKRVEVALGYVFNQSDQQRKFTLDDIFKIDRLLGGKGSVRQPSIVWSDDNNIGVGNYQTPPESIYLESLLQKYVQKYSSIEEDIEPFEKICLAYYVFELIHPFNDRNGRIGRILCSWLMLLNGYPHIVPYLEVKWGDNCMHRNAFDSGLHNYYACLNYSDQLNNFVSQKFYSYFLSEVQSILHQIALEEKLISKS
ncbi:MAG: Fic family protein [Rhabdochlamydiaceae bacterium]|nr:Fic family protein [Rhabdochlamydiaceae bacterium]